MSDNIRLLPTADQRQAEAEADAAHVGAIQRLCAEQPQLMARAMLVVDGGKDVLVRPGRRPSASARPRIVNPHRVRNEEDE